MNEDENGSLLVRNSREEKKTEREALHQTNIYTRRMKLPINRHIK